MMKVNAEKFADKIIYIKTMADIPFTGVKHAEAMGSLIATGEYHTTENGKVIILKKEKL